MPRSRFLGLAPSATLAINERCAEYQRQGKKIYRWGLGQSPFPVPDVVVAALREYAHQKDYLPVKGLTTLREAVAVYYRSRQGLTCSAEDVMIGPGSKELLFLLQMIYDGELLLPNPSWVSYAPQARISGGTVHTLPTRREHGWLLHPDLLEEVAAGLDHRRGVLLLNYPGNPTGTTYDENSLRAIAEIARKYRLLVVSDEIYGELHHEGRHVSFARYYPEGTIVSAGLSKWCGAGGWRLGTFLFPEARRDLLDTMAAVASETFTAVSAPIQYAAVQAYRWGPEVDHFVRQSRLILRAIGHYVADQLRDAGADVALPEGGFYLFPDVTALRAHRPVLRDIPDSTALCERLLQDIGVAVLPGVVFGRPAEELTLRLSYVNFDGELLLRRVVRHECDETFPVPLIEAYCPELVEATRRFCEWLR